MFCPQVTKPWREGVDWGFLLLTIAVQDKDQKLQGLTAQPWYFWIVDAKPNHGWSPLYPTFYSVYCWSISTLPSPTFNSQQSLKFWSACNLHQSSTIPFSSSIQPQIPNDLAVQTMTCFCIPCFCIIPNASIKMRNRCMSPTIHVKNLRSKFQSFSS